MAGLTLFHTDFDLLTTLEADMRARLARFPLFAGLSPLFCYPACFAGTTITEYAPLPQGLTPQALLDVMAEESKKPALAIIKDLPEDSPLLDAADSRFAMQLAQEAVKRGYIEVRGQALAFVPIDFTGPDDYLRRLSPARRKDLRRKQRAANLLDAEVVPFGDGRFLHSSLQEEMYGMYREVFDQSDIHFDLLGPDFFAALTQSRRIKGVVICYRHQDLLVGYNICLIHKGMLIDKYIGFRYPLARELNLYFISWLFNLSFALQEGLNMYVAGWTDPQVKASLGARFTFTRHLVWVKNPVLRRILKSLRGFFEADAHVLEGA
ncbi:MAG: GNAT family N-acetyltransferase [Desulfovibrio sp.]|jgi:predicted N-acyltransferase|nr:GNAT family N-acetyltransferase [Desulfovibrio sp.]